MKSSPPQLATRVATGVAALPAEAVGLPALGLDGRNAVSGQLVAGPHYGWRPTVFGRVASASQWHGWAEQDSSQLQSTAAQLLLGGG